MKLNLKFLILAVILILGIIIQTESKRIKKAIRRNHGLRKLKNKSSKRNKNKVYFYKEFVGKKNKNDNNSKPEGKNEEEKERKRLEEEQNDFLVLKIFEYIFEQEIIEDSQPDYIINSNYFQLKSFGKHLPKYFEVKKNKERIGEKLKQLFYKIYDKKFDIKKIVNVRFYGGITSEEENLLNFIYTHLKDGDYMIIIDKGEKISFYDKNGHFRIDSDDMNAINYVYIDNEKIDKDGNFEFTIYGKTNFHISSHTLHGKNLRDYNEILARKANKLEPTSTEQFEINSYKFSKENMLKEAKTKKGNEDLAKLTETLNTLNLQENETSGDGFCLLNSISKNNYYNFLFNLSSIINTITDNNNQALIQFILERYPNLNNFVNTLYDPNGWMTNEGEGIIVYIARCLNINIRVVRTDGSIIPIIGRTTTIEEDLPVNALNLMDNNLFDVTITHNGNHFNATKPIEDEEDV